jgi:hypothetical protein
MLRFVPPLSTIPAGIVAAIAVCLPTTFARQTADPRQEVERTLATAKFSPAEIGSLQAGKVIARVEPVQNGAELLTQAAVKIRAAHAQVISYYGQMIAYVDGKVTLAFGKFNTPAAPADVAQLSFDRDEIDAMKSCRPGNCDVRLGGATLTNLRSAIDWKAPDYRDQVNAFARKAAIDYVTAYRARGDEALVTFNDRSEPVSLRTEWSAILSNASGLRALLPELARYLGGYPAQQLPGARDVIYWIKEDYGLKPIISIVHGVIYTPPAQPDRTIVAQKYLYASHYYDASLAVASITTGVENGSPITYILYSNRSRGDMLRGGFGGIKGNIARSQARKGAETTLGTIKEVLEAQPR